MSHPMILHILFSFESLLPPWLKPPADNAGTDICVAVGHTGSHQTAGPTKALLTQTSRFSFQLRHSWFTSDSSQHRSACQG